MILNRLFSKKYFITRNTSNPEMTNLIRELVQERLDYLLEFSERRIENLSSLIKIKIIGVDEELVNQCIHRITELFERDDFSTLLILYEIATRCNILHNKLRKYRTPGDGLSDKLNLCPDIATYLYSDNLSLPEEVIQFVEEYMDLIDLWNVTIVQSDIDLSHTFYIPPRPKTERQKKPRYVRKYPTAIDTWSHQLLCIIIYPFLTGYYQKTKPLYGIGKFHELEFEPDLMELFKLPKNYRYSYPFRPRNHEFVTKLTTIYRGWTAVREDAIRKIQTWWRSISYQHQGVTYQIMLSEAEKK